jgi:hypothetical protein
VEAALEAQEARHEGFKTMIFESEQEHMGWFWPSLVHKEVGCCEEVTVEREERLL